MNSNIPNPFAGLSSAERTKLYREQIEQERNQRMEVHRQAIAAHRQLMAARPGTPQPLNLFADGDSWFDYPLPPFQHTDVMAQLPNLSARRPFILNLAHHGDEARDKLGVQQRQRIEYSLTHPAYGPFDAILFSGGGNDTVGDQFCLWLNDAVGTPNPAQALNLPRLRNAIDVVRSAYEDLISIRDRLFPVMPVFIHGYDFAIPTNVGVCGFGPWLYPSLEYRHWNAPINTQIVHAFLLELDSLMQQIETAHKNVIYIRTQGTLAATDWTNELHPNPDGFAKITQKFLAALRTKFGAGSI
ncbi:MAG: hypothetical protein JWQ87_1515 [Candidatus Sulfotelmatobacter sp.]|nr:hypothetical protein [Candidatus Sulfotelmatobacter sp.]